MTKRPDEIVAETIGREFCIHGLIQLDKADEIVKKLGNGILSVEDWKLMAELTLEKKEVTENG